MKLYVGNLPYQVTEEELRRIFGSYGAVKSATVITDRFTGRSKGFGFVEMDSRAAAITAIESLHCKELQGRVVQVQEARSRPARQAIMPQSQTGRRRPQGTGQ
jgi:RNA recognition motif-containing protein